MTKGRGSANFATFRPRTPHVLSFAEKIPLLRKLLMALTGRKRVFADAVLAGLTNKKAAIKAQYSEATASAAGSRLVKDKAVVEYLAAKRAAAAAPPEAPTPPVAPSAPGYESDPMRFLERQMNDDGLEMRFRIDVAKALMPFKHIKLGEGGKKDLKDEAAKRAGAGKFGASAPPKLVAAGGKKI